MIRTKTRRNAHAQLLLAAVALAPIFVLGGCKKKVATGASDASVTDAAPSASASASDVGDAGMDSGAPSATVAVAAPVSPFANGDEWNGSYTCAQGPMSLELQLRGGSQVHGVFTFRKGKTLGQFKMSGSYDFGSKHLSLTAGEWLTHPGSYTTVNLDGHVSADGHTLSGSVIGPGCSTFSVHH